VVPVAAATPAPTAPPVVAFSASHYGSIAVNMGGTIAIAALDRDSAANSMMDSINGCNAKAGGNGCTVHVQFANTADARCGAVAIRRSGRQNIIGSATAGSESDAEARALMKAGTGATILAYGCNTR
ncbi:MAG TPA: DUF4189 domain-containing protein, partial [Candidatus Rubrimentiphilum sp.]|nr:DUF4189 domain-containing protein [Candidatus Rubrimentiphilum sp.]